MRRPTIKQLKQNPQLHRHIQVDQHMVREVVFNHKCALKEAELRRREGALDRREQELKAREAKLIAAQREAIRIQKTMMAAKKQSNTKSKPINAGLAPSNQNVRQQKVYRNKPTSAQHGTGAHAMIPPQRML